MSGAQRSEQTRSDQTADEVNRAQGRLDHDAAMGYSKLLSRATGIPAIAVQAPAADASHRYFAPPPTRNTSTEAHLLAGESFLSMRPVSCEIFPAPASTVEAKCSMEPVFVGISRDLVAGTSEQEALERELEDIEHTEALAFLIGEMSGWRNSLSDHTGDYATLKEKPLPAIPSTPIQSTAEPSRLTGRRPTKSLTHRNVQTTPPVAFVAPSYTQTAHTIMNNAMGASSSRAGGSAPPSPAIVKPNVLARSLSNQSICPLVGRSRSGSLVNREVPTPSLANAGRVVIRKPSRTFGPENLSAPSSAGSVTAHYTRQGSAYGSGTIKESSPIGSSSNSRSTSQTCCDSEAVHNTKDWSSKWSESCDSHDTSVVEDVSLTDIELFTQFAPHTAFEDSAIHELASCESAALRIDTLPIEFPASTPPVLHHVPSTIHPRTHTLVPPPRSSSRLRLLSSGCYPPSTLKLGPSLTSANESRWSLDASGGTFVYDPPTVIDSEVSRVSPKAPTRLRQFISRMGRTSNSSMREAYDRDGTSPSAENEVKGLPLLTASSPKEREDGRWVPTSTPVFSSHKKPILAGAGSFGAKLQKRRLLVIGGLPHGEELPLQMVVQWCEKFGAIKGLTREIASGQILVDFRDKGVAESVSFQHPRPHIVGVGAVLLSTTTRKL